MHSKANSTVCQNMYQKHTFTIFKLTSLMKENNNYIIVIAIIFSVKILDGNNLANTWSFTKFSSIKHFEIQNENITNT